jgi:hypothetical protein
MKLELPKDHPYKDGRECTTCGVFKPASEYKLEKNKNYSHGIAMRSKCKDCERERHYNSLIKRLYNISIEDYEKLLKTQNYRCAICESKIGNSRSSRLFVDHCHQSLKVRGLLCSSCNHGLGQFKDSPKLLAKAIKYLTSDKN